tara:strand:- start:1116 stop:1496 length:381 start_codon:yes stop_codon:yes gene_type:complete
MDATAIAAALNLGSENPTERARDLLKTLEKKFLVEYCGERKPETGSKGGKPSKLYRPTEAVLTLYSRYNPESVKPSIPAEPHSNNGIDGITHGKASRKGESEPASMAKESTKTRTAFEQYQTELEI